MPVIAMLADGRKLQFPDGTSPEVVHAKVQELTRGFHPLDPQSWAAVGSRLKDVGIGAGKDVLHTSANIERAVGMMPAGIGDDPILAPEPGDTVPSNPDQEKGAFLSQMAQFAALPEAGGAASALTRYGIRFAGGAALQSAHQGDVNANSAAAGALNAGGGAVLDSLAPIAKGLLHSAYQNIAEILHPTTEAEQAYAMKLAVKIVREHMMPGGTPITQHLATAEAKTTAATAAREAIQSAHDPHVFDAAPVVQDVLGNAPISPPGGIEALPEARRAARKWMNTVQDTHNLVDATTAPGFTPKTMQPAPKYFSEPDAAKYAAAQVVAGHGLPPRIQEAIANLPPVRPGHVRLFRMEGGGAVEAGAAGGVRGGEWYGTTPGAYAVPGASARSITSRYMDVPEAVAKTWNPAPGAEEFRVPPGYLALARPLETTMKMPLRAADQKLHQLDDLLVAKYKAGKLKGSTSTAAIEGQADAFRHHIAEQFKDLGAAKLNEHEMIEITTMLRRRNAVLDRAGLSASAEGTAAGGLVTNRFSLPAIVTGRALFNSPRYLSLSSAAKRTLSALVANSRLGTRWLALAAMAAVPDESGLPKAPQE